MFGWKDNPYRYNTLLITILLDENDSYPCHKFYANAETLREELEFADEIRIEEALKEIALKQKIVAQHNRRVIKQEFEVGDLVLGWNQKDSEEWKLANNWEGPYKIQMETRYNLERGKAQ